MPAQHSNVGLLDFERVRFGKRLPDLTGDLEIGRQLIGNEALRQGNQPARIAYHYGLIGWRASPKIIEHALNFREPPARATRDFIPKAHAQELEAPEYIQVEQRVRVVHAAVAPRPSRLLPAIKGANHHVRRMDQVVVKTLNLARFESSGPMRFFQLSSEKFLAGSDRSACKEAILEMTGQERLVLQVPDRLSLGVQNGLYTLDDIFAMRQKEPQQLDVGLKRHLTKRLSCHDALHDESALIEREYNGDRAGWGVGKALRTGFVSLQ